MRAMLDQLMGTSRDGKRLRRDRGGGGGKGTGGAGRGGAAGALEVAAAAGGDWRRRGAEPRSAAAAASAAALPAGPAQSGAFLRVGRGGERENGPGAWAATVASACRVIF